MIEKIKFSLWEREFLLNNIMNFLLIEIELKIIFIDVV